VASLESINVLEFCTWLPGQLATLLLAEAGATVIKIERPGVGDEQRRTGPSFGESSASFALLNRGKRSLALDLKAPNALERLTPLLRDCDILVESFRPGVMQRLGLSYEAVAEINPRTIYCSITGYGQEGARARTVGHDLNYVAETGLLDLSPGRAPPPVAIADIGGGSYPAVFNILLALLERERTDRGRQLDIAMADGVFTWLFWALGGGLGSGTWPRPTGPEIQIGGSPRYRTYATADGLYLAVAAIEEHFWQRFCTLIDLPMPLRNPSADRHVVMEAVARRIAASPAVEWERRFDGEDVCCSLVRPLQAAYADPAFVARGLFSAQTTDASGATMPALPIPLDTGLRASALSAAAPSLGELELDAELTWR
jgi:crotonobetainyl-CoA:carnitine CoA-transferase CaiB-like acyl-CoA transferase